MAECLVGDITPWQGISKEEKHKLEESAMARIRDSLKDEIGEQFYQLWLEYENKSSREAYLVKDFDRFEMLVQALEYEKAQGKDLESFFSNTEGLFKDPIVISWVKELYKERNELGLHKKEDEPDIQELGLEINRLKSEMMEAAGKMEFRLAANLQDQLRELEEKIQRVKQKDSMI